MRKSYTYFLGVTLFRRCGKNFKTIFYQIAFDCTYALLLR